MPKFIIKFSIFSLITLLLLLSIGLLKKNSGSADYMEAIVDKHTQLDLIKTPKVLLGGGSNLAFGIDSKELEKAFGVPVVNMGLHAGLGLEFILNDLKYSIKENDVVFLSIEYFLSNDGSYDLKLNTSNYFSPAKQFYRKNYFLDIKNFLDRNRIILKDVFSFRNDKQKNKLNKNVEMPIYSREGFNKYGDVVSHLNTPNSPKLNDREIIEYKYWEGINLINNFYEYAKSKKANVFFLYPNYPISEYKKNIKSINNLDADLRKDLKVEILNNPNDLLFPDDYFFDTIYHLNKLGRKNRTEKMIALIRQNTNAKKCISKIKVVQPNFLTSVDVP